MSAEQLVKNNQKLHLIVIVSNNKNHLLNRLVFDLHATAVVIVCS